MRIIYEQGDIVYNNNNNNYAVVVRECLNGAVKIVEISDEVFVNHVPKSALKYIGSIDLKNRLLDLVESVVDK